MNINQPARTLNLPFLKSNANKTQGSAQDRKQNRLKIMQSVPSPIRVQLVAWIGEFVGTFMFLFLAFSATQVANFVTSGATASQSPNTSNLLYISLSFGFSLTVNAWVFFRITGGLFNPAVTLGLCLIGAIGWIRGAVVFTAQVIGAIAASGVVSALFPGPMNVTTGLNTSTSITRGLFIEMFLTAELIFTIFMLAAEKHKATFLAPIGIGLALFVAELSGVYFTGGSLNPARSFGPAVVTGGFHGYDWIYWVGPFLGSLLAVLFYKLVKALEYETVNPGQDANEVEEEHFANDEPTPTPAAQQMYSAAHKSPAPPMVAVPPKPTTPKPVVGMNRKEHSAV